jgi:hypothetical protein
MFVPYALLKINGLAKMANPFLFRRMRVTEASTANYCELLSLP